MVFVKGVKSPMREMALVVLNFTTEHKEWLVPGAAGLGSEVKKMELQIAALMQEMDRTIT